VGSQRVEAQVLFRLGEAIAERRQYEQAELIMSTVLEMVRRNRDAVGESLVLRKLGIIVSRAGRPAEAEESLRAAIEICERMLDRPGAARAHLDLARLYADRGQTAEAIDLVEQVWEGRARDLLEALIAEAGTARPG
jgi:tetratricopeptide (TPR) repeat protein